MPLFDFVCSDCGKSNELLIVNTEDKPKCKFCGSVNITQQISAHSSMSGADKNRMPGSDDTACCGSSPGHAAGCAGPGSCCGKAF